MVGLTAGYAAADALLRRRHLARQLDGWFLTSDAAGSLHGSAPYRMAPHVAHHFVTAR